jgi:excisionase family DNA binding protein
MMRTLSPKELALAVDVSESSLKRWADSGRIRVTRTAGGHRRISLPEALRFLRESELELVHPEVLGLRDLNVVPDEERGAADLDERLLEYLQTGQTEAARGMILWRFLRGESAAALCDGPIRSAMDSVGRAWRSRPDGIFIEHRATDICLQALDQLRLLSEVSPDAPTVVGGAPSQDPYILPSVMAATALSTEGIRAVNLGPDTPAKTLATAAAHYQAPLVWLSLTATDLTRVAVERYFGELYDSAGRRLTVMVGGRSRHLVRQLKSERIEVGDSMAELLAFARGRLGAG